MISWVSGAFSLTTNYFSYFLLLFWKLVITSVENSVQQSMLFCCYNLLWGRYFSGIKKLFNP